MEKRLFRLIFLFIFQVSLFSQTPSIVEHIRFPIWAELDAYPELVAQEDATLDQYDYPINRIKEISEFLIDGFVYGWSFVYTPMDKARGVDEYLEIKVIDNVEKTEGKIEYSSPWIDEYRLNCWVDYKRTPFQIQNYYLWSSIQNPTIQGRGYADLILGFEGIKKASEEALKDAIRKYFRNTIKNKPKEISGSVLIRKIPTIGIDSGRYVINLDFFLECDRILHYKLF